MEIHFHLGVNQFTVQMETHERFSPTGREMHHGPGANVQEEERVIVLH